MDAMVAPRSSRGRPSGSSKKGGDNAAQQQKDGVAGSGGQQRQRQQQSQPAAAGTTPPPAPQPYTAVVTRRFLLLGTVIPLLAAFAVGRAVRVVFVDRAHDALLAEYDHSLQLAAAASAGAMAASHSDHAAAPGASKALPAPKMKSDREVPKTLYSSKNFDTAASASAKSMLIEKKVTDAAAASASEPTKKKTRLKQWQECPTTDSDDGEEHYDDSDVPEHCKVSASSVAMYADEDESEDEDGAEGGANAEEEEELHLPAGQHLLVDIKEVDGDFLNDEQRLAQAMVDVVWESDLTLLSYHCHKLMPMGVSCVGVLLESHISFHTWPTEGVITLDLFTCGSGLLIPVLPIIERLFGIPQRVRVRPGHDEEEEEVEKPTMVWAHKLRGFRPENDEASRHLRQDVGQMVLGVMDLDMKEEIASVSTKFQHVHVYDVINPKFQDIRSHRRSLSGDGSYESIHPELYLPDRQVFLDGTLQSTRKGDEPYHEALVHPGLVAHPNPKRVAIIGGGEGATLREVLKHDTVEHVKMIDIDAGMVETSREFLPQWSDCSDIVGSTKSCFEDFRADVLYEDALAWFMDRFADGKETEEAKFDVIIMDALDPQDSVPFAEMLYRNMVFTKSVYNALNEDGIVVMQLGIAPHYSDAPDDKTKSVHRAGLIKDMEKVGFESMHAYSESHCGFGDPWSYMVACKDYSCRQNWYANSAQIDIAINARVLRTYSGSPALKHFDGPTMQTYQVPAAGFETVYCRKDPVPEECTYLRGYDPFVANVPAVSFELGESARGSRGLGLYTKVDIPEGSMIMQEKSIHAFNFPPTTFQVMDSLKKHPIIDPSVLQSIYNYMEEYGFENKLYGNLGYDAPSSVMSLINHGCNGTHNVNSDPSFVLTEITADPDRMPVTHYPKGYWKDIFNPVVERHVAHLIGGFDVAVRQIGQGEEILENFLSSVSSEENWRNVVKDLAEKCKKEEAAADA